MVGQQFLTLSSGRVNVTELTAALINQENDLVSGILHAQEVIDGSMTILILTEEGEEGPALAGAKNTIARYRPRLIVSAYHRSEDTFILPLQIARLCPEYRIYLRQHPYIPAWENNIYALAPAKGF